MRRSPVLSALPDSTPAFIPTMQAKLTRTLPVGPQWRYELKLDGYRAEAIKTPAGVRLISRNRKELPFPEIAEAVQALPFGQGVLDGEIVALDSDGKPSFQALQDIGIRRRDPRPVFYFVFDLLNLEGKTLLGLPLVERKGLLDELLAGQRGHIRFVPFLEGNPAAIVAEVGRQGLEGIVAKHAQSRYEPGKRSGAWTKFKIGQEREFVIGGYTLGRGGRSPFGALIVGYYEQGRLRYASKVGSGFGVERIREFVAVAKALQLAVSPFEHIPESEGGSWSHGLTAWELRTAIWLKPVLVCRVRFIEWTRDGHLRHAVFVGLGER